MTHAHTEEYQPVFVGKVLDELQTVLQRYPNKMAALLPALWIAQREHGWISDRIMAEVAELLERLAREDGPVLFGAGRRVVDVHRSISPMTMSTDALMAMRSLNRRPSAILAIDARLMKDGGRMRQRTGLAVPSDTK